MRWIFALLVVGFAALSTAPANAAPDPPIECLSAFVMERVKAKRSIEPAWAACGAEGVRAELGPGFADLHNDDLKVVLATFVAPRLAPYGPSNAVSLREIMAAETLNCVNLVHFMAQVIGDEYFDFIGMHGGRVGNHAQIAYSREDVSILLDPTIGLIARTDFDSLFSGKPVSDEHVVRRYPTGNTEMQLFADNVTIALLEGAYLPSDILYFFEDWDHMRNPLGRYEGIFVTPGGVDYRLDISLVQ